MDAHGKMVLPPPPLARSSSSKSELPLGPPLDEQKALLNTTGVVSGGLLRILDSSLHLTGQFFCVSAHDVGSFTASSTCAEKLHANERREQCCAPPFLLPC